MRGRPPVDASREGWLQEGSMSKLRRTIFVLVVVATLAASAFGEEERSAARHARSIVERFLVWVMDGLSSPPG